VASAIAQPLAPAAILFLFPAAGRPHFSRECPDCRTRTVFFVNPVAI
jgi:hypothetical protein